MESAFLPFGLHCGWRRSWVTPGRSWVGVKFFYCCAYPSCTTRSQMVSSLPLVLGFSSDLVFQKMCLSHALASFPEGTLLVTEPLLVCWWLQEGCFPLFSFSLGLTQSSCSWIFRGHLPPPWWWGGTWWSEPKIVFSLFPSGYILHGTSFFHPFALYLSAFRHFTCVSVSSV